MSSRICYNTSMDGTFWHRVDLLRKGKSLRKLCADAGLNYHTVMDQRYRKRAPSAEDAMKIARVLNVQAESLFPCSSTPAGRKERIIQKLIHADEEDIILIEKIFGIHVDNTYPAE